MCLVNKSSHLSSAGELGMDSVLLSKSSSAVCVVFFVGLVEGNNSLMRAMEGVSIGKYSFLFKWHSRAAGNRVYRLLQGDRVVEANLTPLLSLCPVFQPSCPCPTC